MGTKRWQDWVMLVFGIWLFVAPFWMGGYESTGSVAARNSYILGILVFAFGWAALATARRWEEWVELVLGIWLIISPFVLGFWGAEHGAGWNQLILGILIGLDAIWALSAPRPSLPQATA
jgi:hypothetical protein